MLTVSLAAMLMTVPAAVHAQSAVAPVSDEAAAATALTERANQLPALLRGEMAYDAYFTPEFLAAVPSAQMDSVRASLQAQYGEAAGVARVAATDATNATVFVTFAKGVGQFSLTIDPAQDGRAAGLLVTGFETSGDSAEAVLNDYRALPGTVNLLVAELTDDGPHDLMAHNADTSLAIGSTFKLYILAELAERARRRKLGWDHVTTVTRKSFSSSATQRWPVDGPVTLHTLASWMISVSDNGASDNLLEILGRDAVGQRLTAIGNSVAARNLPFLNTVEAFALKSPANDTLRAQFLATDEAGQRRLIDDAADRLTLDAIQGAMFVGKPMHIDTIEWFGSARDMVRLLDHLRTRAGPVAHKVMAINPGIAPDAAARWAYVGYKGGSEAGVISMSFLLQARSGRWFAVTGSWNNAAAPVDNAKFAALMQRLVDMLARQTADAPAG